MLECCNSKVCKLSGDAESRCGRRGWKVDEKWGVVSSRLLLSRDRCAVPCESGETIVESQIPLTVRRN